jgi:peptidoglycan/LPS O-acetylase OafA/YrhL
MDIALVIAGWMVALLMVVLLAIVSFYYFSKPKKKPVTRVLLIMQITKDTSIEARGGRIT